MSEPTIKGKVGVIEPTKTYGNRGFRKRLVILEQAQDKWTNYIPLTFTGDSCESADINTLMVGDEIEARYLLNGRKWQRDENSDVRYFVDLEVVSFEVIAQKSASTTEVGESVPQSETPEANDGPPPDDDIPF